MGTYNPKRFRELVYSQEKEVPKTLLLKDLFLNYIENYEGIALKTRQHFRLSINKLESFQPELTVYDITPEFLRRYEVAARNEGLSRAGRLSKNVSRLISGAKHQHYAHNY